MSKKGTISYTPNRKANGRFASGSPHRKRRVVSRKTRY